MSLNIRGAELERLYHEPGRLAIMSHLCGDTKGVTFTELRRRCALTDGNLSQHLRVLEQAGAVRMHKAFVRSRPRTTLYATDLGRDDFLRYLQTLEKVLRQALEALPSAAQARWRLGAADWNAALDFPALGARGGRSEA